jgi:hypothetical protein
MFGVLVNSDTYWNKGQNKITEQVEARIIMDTIARDLRQSNTNWGISIDNSENKILFYKPVFNDSGYKTGTHWVIFKPNITESHKYERKEQGASAFSAFANYVENVTFYGSSDGCITFNSTTVSSGCPRIRITVKTKKDNEFSLVSEVALRNQAFTNDTVEVPEEGEF